MADTFFPLPLITGQDEGLSILPFVEDESLLQETLSTGQPRLRLYSPQTTMVVLGRNSKPSLELCLESCLIDQVPLFRRRGGGCAVVLDPGNVIVTVILPAPGIGHAPHYFKIISAWIAAALSRLGLDAVQQQGFSDLALRDKKIGGACIYRAKNLLYYSTTLLFHPNLGLLERYLKHPPREPAYRQGRTHADFVIPIKPLMSFASVEDFKNALGMQLKVEEYDVEYE